MSMINLFDALMFHNSKPWLKILPTLFLNFRCLPFKQAIKLPICIYGKVSLYWVQGKIEIKSDNIYGGMIKLGCNNEFFNGSNGSAFIYLQKKSKIIFNGPCAISNNYSLRVASGATLEFGAYTFFGSSVKFICTDSIKIGDYTRCAYESQLVDTNSHFVFNENNKKVARKNGHIEIGAFNWIGNRTTMTKGVRTKNATIVCANSTLNKDYTKLEDENQMLGGTPAKLITSGLRRIFSIDIDKKIEEYFSKNVGEEFYEYSDPFIDRYDDIEYWFKNIM